MPFDAARKRGQKPFVRTVDTVTRRLDGPRAAGFDRWGLLSIVTTDGWLTTSPRRFSHVLFFNAD